MTRYFLALCAAVGLLVFTSAAPAAELVLNGSFEDASQDRGSVQLTDWSVDSSSYLAIHHDTEAFEAADGHTWLSLGESADPLLRRKHREPTRISQVLETEPGETYVLSFAYTTAGRSPHARLNVYWDGALLDVARARTHRRADAQWHYMEYEVSATTAATSLAFADRNSRDNLATYLDDVRVSRVPEPATIVLLAMGVTSLIRRRR